METNVNEIIFEGEDNSQLILPEKLSYHPMEQFVNSNYFKDNALQMYRFLDEDRTIDLEKLELAIILLIEYLEYFNKNHEPIYIYLGGMKEYFDIRGIGIKDVERVVEESSFILGFCNSVAQENKINNVILVFYKVGDGVSL